MIVTLHHLMLEDVTGYTDIKLENCDDIIILLHNKVRNERIKREGEKTGLYYVGRF